MVGKETCVVETNSILDAVAESAEPFAAVRRPGRNAPGPSTPGKGANFRQCRPK